MFSNEDNSSVEINVNKGGNGMSEGTVSIGVSEYKALLELAFKATVIKDVMFANAKLNYDGTSLICGVGADADTVAKYLFPEECAEKFAELTKEDGE